MVQILLLVLHKNRSVIQAISNEQCKRDMLDPGHR